MNEREKRRRRRHPALLSPSGGRVPGARASVSGVALERQINANLLRRWIKEAQRRELGEERAE